MTEPLNKEQVQNLLDDSPYISFMNLEVVSMDLDGDEIVISLAGTASNSAGDTVANSLSMLFNFIET